MTHHIHARYEPCGDTEMFDDPSLDGTFQFPLVCPACGSIVEGVREA